MRTARPKSPARRVFFFFTLSAVVLVSLVLSSTVLVQSNSRVRAPQISKLPEHTSSQNLCDRLLQLNNDINTKGLHEFPPSQERLLTGYAYGEFFDWDLYFENVYLSYYGVGKFDFSNLEMFLSRQKSDGFISRTLGITHPKPNQMFKPFLAQLAVLGSQQTGFYE